MAKPKIDKSPAAPVAQLTTEIATFARDPFFNSWGGIIRPRDETLATRGGGRGIWIYDDIKRDGEVFAALEKRTLGLLSRPLVVEAASDDALDTKAADAIRAHFKRGRINRLTRTMCDAILKGFSVSEVMWGVHRGLFMPMQFKARDQRRFVFDDDGNMRLLVRESMVKGIELPDRKMIVHRCGDTDENPYGLGIGSRLFWLALFKRQGISFWLQFIDKFGSPTVIGKYPAGVKPDSPDKLMLDQAVQLIRSGTSATMPEGMIVELLELKASGNITTQEQLVRYCDEQIRTCVGLESGGKSGGGALAAAAIDRREVRLDVVKADDEEISETLQSTIVKWICEINFPGAEPPELHRDTDEPEDLDARVARDKTLFDMGYRVTAAQVSETYGGEYEDVRPAQLEDEAARAARAKLVPGQRVAPNAKALPSPQDMQPTESNVDFAAEANAATFPDQQAIDDALNALSATDQQALMVPIMQPLIDFINGCADPLEALGKLTEQYPKMDVATLEKLLARVLFVALVHGKLSADDEVGAAA